MQIISSSNSVSIKAYLKLNSFRNRILKTGGCSDADASSNKTREIRQDQEDRKLIVT